MGKNEDEQKLLESDNDQEFVSRFLFDLLVNKIYGNFMFELNLMKIWIHRINGVATKSLNTKLLHSSRTN